MTPFFPPGGGLQWVLARGASVTPVIIQTP